MLLDDAMNGHAFLAYVEQVLVLELVPENILIIDNLATHKVDGVRKAIETKDAMLLYFPPYSPDLNPIAMAFPKLKSLFKKAAEKNCSFAVECNCSS